MIITTAQKGTVIRHKLCNILLTYSPSFWMFSATTGLFKVLKYPSRELEYNKSQLQFTATFKRKRITAGEEERKRVEKKGEKLRRI